MTKAALAFQNLRRVSGGKTSEAWILWALPAGRPITHVPDLFAAVVGHQ
jgi:hypothetical protein